MSADTKLGTDLQRTLEIVRNQNRGVMSQYHRDLAQWAKNVDKRYAWVVLFALWLIMAAMLGPYRIYGLLFAKITTDGIYTREEASWPVSAIFTTENIVGPFVSVITYYISYRQSMFIGGLLLVLGNGLAGFSNSLVLDVLLIGVVQGVGYAAVFMPVMEIVNSYFLRYRNLALGFALCGGTVSVFVWSPIFQWLLSNYPWRYSYFGLGLVCSISLFMVPLLKPNPRPEKPLESGQRKTDNQNGNQFGSLSRNTVRALAYQNSIRRQSTILINRQESERGRCSVISVNPFASSVGLERKISRAITSDNVKSLESNSPASKGALAQHHPVQRNNSEIEADTMSFSEVGKEDSDFDVSVIWSVLRTPAFHLIWYNELVYFWVFSIYCLVIVDYGEDRGCTTDESEMLLSLQSAGELIGRLGLTVLVDMNFMSNKNVVVLVLFFMAGTLAMVTQVTGFIMMAVSTVLVSSLSSLLYILLNGLLVDYLGEHQVTIGYGMASCIGGILMSLRPQAVGFFRDYMGSYDPLMLCLAGSCAIGGLLWIVEPLVSRLCCVRPPEADRNRSEPAGESP